MNISSISGTFGNFGQTNYSAAKAALICLTGPAPESYARATAYASTQFSPGSSTPMTRTMPEQGWADRMRRLFRSARGSPHEVAGCVAFLCSEMASYVPGDVLEVLGGATCDQTANRPFPTRSQMPWTHQARPSPA